MATTKRNIADQVLRIINGGDISDDNKITYKEVEHLIDHERDNIIKKVIMENSALGEHEIPSEFISMKTITTTNEDPVLGVEGRMRALFTDKLIYLPNDNSVYQVCPAKFDHMQIKGDGRDPINVNLWDERRIEIEQIPHMQCHTKSDVSINFSIKKETDVIGNKFKFTFNHGLDSSSLKAYSFMFTYKNGGKNLTSRGINPQLLLMGLESNSSFQEFLKVNRLRISYEESNETTTTLKFTSSYGSQYWGGAGTTPFNLISSTTNKSVITDGGSGLSINSTFSGSTPHAEPSISFGIKIDYSKNKKLKDLGPDSLGVKEKGSSVLNTVVELSHEDIMSSFDGGYNFILGRDLCIMWVNKYQAVLKTYGIHVAVDESQDFIIFIEESPSGGFDKVEFQNFSNTAGEVTSREDVNDEPVKVNLALMNDMSQECFYRMPNAGQTPRLYKNAILMSGKGYWYRQQNYIYLYNTKHHFPDRSAININVWFLADSSNFGSEEPFPVPPEYVPEIVQNLIQTFTVMRTAKEDVINDNTDI